uniref:Uncharacterized protein n=1 Tax=Craspedostauros australis TaxID=1486917 RepID=A0A7R9ZPK5_9STRA|mmetsp:Transcript_22845/g.63709  ORF Transcript_22845/g.63709 Transcript_22845/m.63709 type:complete len:108 (+) Transcript_22845:526-849(+)
MTTASTEADTLTMRIFSADEWQQLDEYLAHCDDDDELLMTSCSMLDSSFPCHGEPDIRTLGNEIVEARSDLGSDTSSNCNCDFSGSTLRDDDGKVSTCAMAMILRSP